MTCLSTVDTNADIDYRQRKTKCSGDRPRCMNCRRVNRSCHYESYSATMAAMAANPLAAFPPGFGDVWPPIEMMAIARAVGDIMANVCE